MTKNSKGSFQSYLAEDSSVWSEMTLQQKEYAIHDYLNHQCGASVLTHLKDTHFIVVEYDPHHTVSLFSLDAIENIEIKIDVFLKQLETAESHWKE